MTITADAPVEYLLYRSSGRRWTNIDIELETGCGIVPLTYKDKAAVSALQWAVGLELFLLSARSVARRAVDRPPERGLVPGVSRADPAADGPERAGRPAQARESQAPGRQRAGRRARPRVHAQRDRDHHPRRTGPAARTQAEGPPGRGRRCGRHDLQPRPGPRHDVLDAALRPQGWCAHRRGGPAPSRPAGPRLRVAPAYDDAVLPSLTRHFEQYSTVAFDNYPVRTCRASRWRIG